MSCGSINEGVYNLSVSLVWPGRGAQGGAEGPPEGEDVWGQAGGHGREAGAGTFGPQLKSKEKYQKERKTDR